MALKITEDCIACGTCVDTCPVSAISLSGDKYIILSDCTECHSCVDCCPVSAIVD